MCLTIPKKVISREGDFFVVENPNGIRQKVKSIVDLKIGDFVLTQQNIAIQKISKKEFEEINELFNEKKEEKCLN